jgi:magnesium transporter
MSDHDEVISDAGYDTPVPELDDHRNQASATQRHDRPRRGTFDSLYGGRAAVEGFALVVDNGPIVRDFSDCAIADDDAASPTAGPAGPSSDPVSPSLLTRRPTLEPVRDQSPPNSIKAFAEARRRERGLSFTEPRPERRIESRSETWPEGPGGAAAAAAAIRPDLEPLARTTSGTSRRSRLADDASSLISTHTAEEDVCFPVLVPHRRDQLYIDFDYLERFIQESEMRTLTREDSAQHKSFVDLRPQVSHVPTQLPTVDGDIIEMPSSSDSSEKDDPSKRADTAMSHTSHAPPPPPPPQPDRVSFFSSAWPSTIHATELSGLTFGDERLRDLFEMPKGETDGVWWLNLNNPSKDEVQAICKAFGIHPLTVEDISTGEAREKIELFPAYYFASFRSFNAVPDGPGVEYEPFNIYVIVFREGTLSFSFAPNAHASRVRKRIAILQDFVALSSDWICYALIDDIVDCFAPVIQRIEFEADAIEDAVFVAREADNSEFLQTIGRVRKNVMALMRLLGGKADVLRGFTKRCNENYKVTPRMDIGLYLGDIQDHVVTMVNNLGHFEKILSRAHSNYLATLSINSMAQSNDTNRVLSKITFLATVLVPLNLVCGLFGMNVAVPWMDSPSLVPFFVIIGTLCVSCTIIMIWARRMKYI